MKLVMTLIGMILLAISGVMLYQNYQESVDPTQIYGTWIETEVLNDRKETLTLDEHRVLRNNRLVATQFEFDGKEISFHTGEGDFLYRWNGSSSSPQLIRQEPEQPIQTLIKQGYEDTL